MVIASVGPLLTGKHSIVMCSDSLGLYFSLRALSVTLICWELSLMLSSRLRASSISCAFRFFSTCSLCFSVATFLLWSFVCLQEAQAKYTNFVREHLRNTNRGNVHHTYTQIILLVQKTIWSPSCWEQTATSLVLHVEFFHYFPLPGAEGWLKKKKGGGGWLKTSKSKWKHICRWRDGFIYSKQETDSVSAKLHWEAHCRPVASVSMFIWLRRLNSVLAAS